MSTTAGRVYGGLTPDERREKRRGQFMQAGLEVFAAKGWAASTVLDICQAARLSQRYFYELHASREALFLAVLERIASEVEAAVRAAATVPDQSPRQRARGVLLAVFGYFRRDPRTVRVALIESFATADFREHRAELLASFSTLAAQLMRALNPDRAQSDGRALELSATILSGGIAELLASSVTTGTPEQDEQLIDHLTALYSAAAMSNC